MLFKDYNSLPNFLIRKTLLRIGRLHIRSHNILSEDKSPYVHNHPFYYISIILKGGYTEQLLEGNTIKEIKHRVGSIIYRIPKNFHRIKSIDGPTRTLFLTYKVKIDWKLKKNDDLNLENYKVPEKNGIYIREIKGKSKFYKFNEFWYIGHENVIDAQNEKRLSIHQSDEYSFK